MALFALFRLSGKATLTKLSASNLIITAALGLTLATRIVCKDAPLLDAVRALTVLIALQWIVTVISA